jgi:hypothetical protein
MPPREFATIPIFVGDNLIISCPIDLLPEWSCLEKATRLARSPGSNTEPHLSEYVSRMRVLLFLEKLYLEEDMLRKPKARGVVSLTQREQ